jgi:hypothetical protein
VMAATGKKYTAALDVVRLARINGTLPDYMTRIAAIEADGPGLFGRCLRCLAEHANLGERCPCGDKRDRIVVRGTRHRNVEPPP